MSSLTTAATCEDVKMGFPLPVHFGVAWSETDRAPFVGLRANNTLAFVDQQDPDTPNRYGGIRSETGFQTGKYYWEVETSQISATRPALIAAGVSQDALDTDTNPLFGQSTNFNTIIEPNTTYGSFGIRYKGGDTFGPSFSLGTNILSFTLDLDAKTLGVSLNGTFIGLLNSSLDPSGTYHAYATITDGRIKINLGNSNFSYSVPAGFQPFDSSADAQFTKPATKEFNNISILSQVELFRLPVSTQGEFLINSYNYRAPSSSFNPQRIEPTGSKETIYDGDIIIQDEIVPPPRESGRIKG